MMSIIKMDGAEYSYASHVPEVPPVRAVQDMTLEVPQGAFWVVLGKNGSGKSTLSRLMNALLLPQGGAVYIDGLCTKEEQHLWEVRRTVGVVFQNPDNQIVATTVEEDVAFGPENLGIEQKEIRRLVDESLEIVGMTEYLTHSPHLLSGGQKQRVAISGILAMRPKCIVLDEATSMLDPQGRKEVLQAVRMLHDDHGMTVVLITHHMEEAVGADQVLVMQDGKKLLSGTPFEVFQHVEELRQADLDVPQITALGELLRSSEMHRGQLPVTESDAAAMLDALLCTYNSTKAVPGSKSQMNQLENVVLFDSKVASEDERIMRDAVKVTGAGTNHEKEEADLELDSNRGNPTHPLIKVINLRHVYMPGTLYERTALDGISLSIHKGEILGVIGHTGSGKSTLVQHLNGLLKATSGTIEVDGIQLDQKSLKKLRQKVGLIFQYPEHQLFEETVSKDIAYGLVQRGLPSDEIARRVTRTAELLSIPEELLEKSPFELSGGQKRKVAIAGVLAMEPDILILDEPTAGLDPKGSKEVFRLLRDLNVKQGTTIVLITHSMESLAAFADRIAVLKKGRLVHEGTPREIFGMQDILQRMQLGVPVITRIFSEAAGRKSVYLPTVLTVKEAADWLVHHCEKGRPA